MDSSLEQKKAAYLTHELRAPLTAIICALEVLKERMAAVGTASTTAKEDAEMLNIALRNAERLNQLIGDIMDMSKIQNGSMKLLLAPCDPAALAKETVENMLPWAKHKGLKLILKAAADCPPAYVDGRRSAQILTNLISNAIKFTPAGGTIEVSVETGRRQQAGYLVMSVRDTGIGIATQDLGSIFRYFVQAGPPETREEGTGLGLALARSMAEIQGGQMWADSRLGQGSTFSFTLPIFMGAAVNNPAPACENPQSQP